MARKKGSKNKKKKEEEKQKTSTKEKQIQFVSNQEYFLFNESGLKIAKGKLFIVDEYESRGVCVLHNIEFSIKDYRIYSIEEIYVENYELPEKFQIFGEKMLKVGDFTC